MQIKPVFNLEFPPYVYELSIGGYVFRRKDDYDRGFGELQHLVNSSGSEFSTKIQLGSHQVTATVEIPDSEEMAVLEWADEDSKRLMDITLLLSIFTRRSVFVDMDEDGGVSVLQDHRKYTPFGGEIILSLPNVHMCREKSTGTVCEQDAMSGRPVWEFERFDAGFEKGLNEVLELIATQAWREKYQNGYFLFLLKQALHRQIIETSFILCWSIWEHLFAIRNQSWMDPKTIFGMSGKEKITFVYNEYLGQSSQVLSEIEKLVKTRNRIVHFGRRAQEEDSDAMERFIRMTERLIAVILNLTPSFALEGTEQLRKTLSGARAKK